MRNIFLLTSELYKAKFIYITNDEKIEDGEYGLCVNLVDEGFDAEHAVFKMDNEQRESMVSLGGQIKARALKVVMTNDNQLVNDGVQEFDNSSLLSDTDYVEVLSEVKCYDKYGLYKIGRNKI